MGKPRQKSMKRAYLKRFSSEQVKAPRTPHLPLIEQYKEHVSNPNVHEPVRKFERYSYMKERVTEHGTEIELVFKKTPSITEPKQEVVNSLRSIWEGKADQIEPYRTKLVDTPLCKLWLVFTGFGPRDICWFEKLDVPTNTMHKSFTCSDRANAKQIYKDNAIDRRLGWKD